MNQISKKELRERILVLLRRQKEAEWRLKSFAILSKLFMVKQIQEAQTILFYASYDGEVDTTDMIKRARQLGKTILLPQVNAREKRIIPTLWEISTPLVQGPFGIQQPADGATAYNDLWQINAVIVPGVAFDNNRHRLGRGGGFYDRFLERLPRDIPTIGLAFDFQIVDAIPEIQPHDKAIGQIISN